MIKKLLRVIILLVNYGLSILMLGLGWMSAQKVGLFSMPNTKQERIIGFTMIMSALLMGYLGQKVFIKKKLLSMALLFGINLLVFQILTSISY